MMELDLTSLILKVSADVPWRDAEARIRRSGLTLGFTPPLFVGDAPGNPTLRDLFYYGAQGLRAPLYGAPAERCIAVEAPVDGALHRTPLVPRSAAGPDFKALTLGPMAPHTELTLLWLRVSPLPAAVADRAFAFEAPGPFGRLLARLLQMRVTPAIALGELPREGGASAYIAHLRFEGLPEIVAARCAVAARLAGELGGAEVNAPGLISTLEAGLQEDPIWPDHALERSYLASLRSESGRTLIPWGRLTEALGASRPDARYRILVNPTPEEVTLCTGPGDASEPLRLARLSLEPLPGGGSSARIRDVIGDLRAPAPEGSAPSPQVSAPTPPPPGRSEETP